LPHLQMDLELHQYNAQYQDWKTAFYKPGKCMCAGAWVNFADLPNTTPV